MKINLLCIISITLSALIACGGSNLDHIPQDRSESLTGIDADHNGIRDDIDHYIRVRFNNSEQRKAVEQFARRLQDEMMLDLNNNPVVRKLAFEKSRAIGCIYENFPAEIQPKAAEVTKNLISKTMNNNPRLKVHLNMSKALDGAALSLPTDDLCD